MKERDDFIDASRAQAQRIVDLEAELASVKGSHATALEQLDVQTLIAEHRARRIEELMAASAKQEQTSDKLRQSVRLLWGCFESVASTSADARDLLESLDGMLTAKPAAPAAEADGAPK